MKSDLVVFFTDGSSSPIDLTGDSGEYRRDGLDFGFTIGTATRRDGIKRVIFLCLNDGSLQQTDNWISSLGKQPGLSVVS